MAINATFPSMNDDHKNPWASRNGADHPSDGDNIIRLPDAETRRRLERERLKSERLESERLESERLQQQRLKQKQPGHGPLINLPPTTKILIGLLLAIHVIVSLLPPEQRFLVIERFGFTPAAYRAGSIDFLTLIDPFTYTLIHGGWIHVGMNVAMLAAFGAGVERWMGGRRMVMFCVMCSLAGALAHFLLNMDSPDPVVGASGAISGLFAAVMVMMNKMQRNAGAAPNAMLPFIGVWIVSTIVLGSIGAPGGGAVAWAAHIGGFLGGFAALKLLRVA